MIKSRGFSYGCTPGISCVSLLLPDYLESQPHHRDHGSQDRDSFPPPMWARIHHVSGKTPVPYLLTGGPVPIHLRPFR